MRSFGTDIYMRILKKKVRFIKYKFTFIIYGFQVYFDGDEK